MSQILYAETTLGPSPTIIWCLQSFFLPFRLHLLKVYDNKQKPEVDSVEKVANKQAVGSKAISSRTNEEGRCNSFNSNKRIEPQVFGFNCREDYSDFFDILLVYLYFKPQLQEPEVTVGNSRSSNK